MGYLIKVFVYGMQKGLLTILVLAVINAYIYPNLFTLCDLIKSGIITTYLIAIICVLEDLNENS